MGNFQFTNWIPSPLTHKDFVPAHFSSFSCSTNFPFTVINSIWEKRHNFSWPPGFPSIIILFLFPAFSRCFSITPRLHCLTSHSLSLSLFFPCSVFNPSEARFSSCQPGETSDGRVTKPRLPQVVTSFLKHFLHLASETPNSLGFLPASLAVPSQSHLLITPLCLLHPILSIQPHNTWSSRLVFGILFSLFPDDFMAFETIYMFMISTLYSQPSLILCTPDLYLCLFILQSSQNYHGQ